MEIWLAKENEEATRAVVIPLSGNSNFSYDEEEMKEIHTWLWKVWQLRSVVDFE